MANRSNIKNSIVLVSFPFDDLSATKVRPAICLTTTIGKFEHIVIAFISSKIPKEILDSDIIIRKNTVDWEETGLSVDSLIRIHKMTTIPKSMIKRKLGEINSTTKNMIQEKIAQLFEL